MSDETFVASVKEMEHTLYRITCSQLPVEADREDAIQETLRRAWEKRASLRNECYLGTWIVRILLNVCHNIQKERKRMVPTADFPDREMPVYSDAVEFRDCLFQLEERERMPVVLYYIEGYTIQQVASILRIPQGTVKSRLDRGRRQLRDICREEVFVV